MLTYENIINAFTLILSNEFKYDVFTSAIKQGFKEKCFYVSVIPSPTERVTRTAHKKNLTVSIKYFNDTNKMNLYDVSNSLEALFSRYIKVKDRTLTIRNTECNLLTDNVGDFLDFWVSLSFIDNDVMTKEEIEKEQATEVMQDIKINKGVIK